MPHGLDTDKEVFFYEQEFYVLSNFSAFQVTRHGIVYPTAEHAYQWAKFAGTGHYAFQRKILTAPSAHEAFRIAREWSNFVHPIWKENRVAVMHEILRAKVEQHEYVRRKLRETGSRRIVENSWRDDFWGWGPNRDGQNMLGKLWMEVRHELFHDLAEPEKCVSCDVRWRCVSPGCEKNVNPKEG